jgi:hypothetical protein
MSKHYAFIGQLMTTFGTPHDTTGRCNIYGELIAFETIKGRQNFIDDQWVNSPYVSIVSTNLKTAKTLYFAGLTQLQFDEHIKYVDSGCISIARFICP